MRENKENKKIIIAQLLKRGRYKVKNITNRLGNRSIIEIAKLYKICQNLDAVTEKNSFSAKYEKNNCKFKHLLKDFKRM